MTERRRAMMQTYVWFGRPSPGGRICAALFLLLTAPVFLAIALAIKVDSCGPVFTQTRRVDRRGARRTLLRFRTIVVVENGDARPLPTVTRVGKFLRDTELESLPELLSVAL